MKRLIRFIKECYAELKKVVWPSRSAVASSTKVVLISTVMFAVALGAVDFVLVKFIDLVF